MTRHCFRPPAPLMHALVGFIRERRHCGRAGRPLPRQRHADNLAMQRSRASSAAFPPWRAATGRPGAAPPPKARPGLTATGGWPCLQGLSAAAAIDGGGLERVQRALDIVGSQVRGGARRQLGGLANVSALPGELQGKASRSHDGAHFWSQVLGTCALAWSKPSDTLFSLQSLSKRSQIHSRHRGLEKSQTIRANGWHP